MMKLLIQVVHWIVYAYYVYLFGYASLFKVFQKESMMISMDSLGFNKTWTLLIGYGELLGVVGLLVGLWFHEVKNIAVLWLFPFAVGALMVHFAHHEYEHYYAALFGCFSSLILLATDKYFKIAL
ncbi:DoxX family protein [Fulvivirga ulvae]|uniref:DoxX family protein n=1 Tax=Fulvivirga ulvae TaxID=2904245 RepID=UPI001F2025A7|nr:DoxX family protein [Fulvivirga ulvae]UII31411.1 DoxX family protein [Fulvivirga ulvae]